MSISINFKNVVKKYNDVTVIPGLSFDIKQGEFFTLLGPSGCGKTTLLRMVAGFNSIEGGEISFGDKVINHIPPQHRNIGMVFQNYAIFPHLTVKKNVAFGLGNRKLAKEVIEKRVSEMLDIVQIKQFADRLPENLSGGQQQRVALARAIVIQPSVLLMDEPLSNLDAKLRVDMRNAIKDIQRKVGITTVYVTHDQEEAMAVSDRIAVMNLGTIQQLGTPQTIYQRPVNTFVASFIGRTNIMERNIDIKNGKYTLVFDENYSVDVTNIVIPKDKGSVPVKLSVRPEEFMLDKDHEEGIEAKVLDNVFLGLNNHYFVELNNGEKVEVIQESTIGEAIEPGTKVRLRVQREKINIFDYESEINLIEGVTNGV
ncbi:ABC transporter ATP-binding protein [Bacillus sp. FSL K6-3431]|uniref:ABC transporter ATP-binding protein n=1 Tax=Bacillus sp. FSL K6-3431 TaxID=2921500 RepID=UPI0030FCDC8C